MVGYNHNNSDLNWYHSAFAGAFSGTLTRFLCQPLDVVKIRLQLQVEPINYSNKISKYRGTSHAFGTIVKEEGLNALWKGHMPAQALSIVYGTIQFAVYESSTKQIAHCNEEWAQNSTAHFACGAVATGSAILFSYPWDVIRTRLVAQGNDKIYVSVSDTIRKLHATEGSRAFFKGLTPTILQAAPHGGAQFAFYAMFSNIFIYTGLNTKDMNSFSVIGILVNWSSGFLSGIFAKIVVYPFDLCRKRLQIQGFQDFRKEFGKPFYCNGFRDCVLKVYRQESIRGFYKGLQTSLLKAAFVTAFQFTLYEEAFKYLVRRNNKR